MNKDPIFQAFKTGHELLGEFISRQENIDRVKAVSTEMASIFTNGGKVMIFGNGGSACDAAHFAEEFTARFRHSRPSLPVITFNEAGHLTCVGNDYGFDQIFVRPLKAFAKAADMAIGISTSGNSVNVKLALDAADKLQVKTVLFSGKGGGLMKGLYDYEWIVPGETTDRIQELHMMILHIIIEAVERRMFPENYKD